MNLRRFIENPVLSTVISIMIVLLGILGLISLPITQYPDIAPPTVQVSATYTGANAETVMQSVVVPLEEQINGVEGMDYITSTASNDGSASISILFKQGIDPDIAAVNVQNRVSRATPLLPSEVTKSGVTTQKQQTSALMFLTFYSTNKDYNDTFIQNYLNINVVPEIQRIYGVGNVNVLGGKNYAMRIWIDPQKLANYKLTPTDVTAAISEQSLESAAGSIGQNDGQSFEYIIKYSGRFNDAEQYKQIVIKALDNGQVLRLGDVADIKLDALSYTGLAENNGNPAVSMGIFQTPGSNARDIINETKSKLDDISKDLPSGINYVINYDTNDFLNESISKVVHTLVEAFILVFIVVFIFLQDFRSTLIPAIAVPVSIVGTFFFLNLFGYSINLLTLFALVLAIGIVVDDAIVVVEAVHAKMEVSGKNAKESTIEAMTEISGAIVSITLVMAAVFVPVTFIQGTAGVFYQQFGVTLIIAIIISAVNALTLSPALCALFLKSHEEHVDEHGNKKKRSFIQRFYDAFNRGFDRFTKSYLAGLSFFIKNKWATFLVILLSVAAIYWVNKITPSGFVPNEDRGLIFADIQMPPGTSMDKTHEVVEKLRQEIKDFPGFQSITFVSGRSLINGNGSNYALGFIKLKSFEEREDASLQADALTKRLFSVTPKFPNARIIFFQPPSIQGFGMSSGFEFKLLDKAGNPVKDVDNTTQSFLGKLMQEPSIQYASTSFNTNYPQYQMDVNVPLAKQMGVGVSDIFSAMQGYIGGLYTADFTKFGKQYRVMIQSMPQYRKDINSLSGLYVKTASGNMTPISQFVKLNKVYGPQTINRYNLYTSANVQGAPNPGFSTGDAITAINKAAESLPNGYGVEYTGLTREELKSGNQTVMIFALCVIFVYFILSAQYESYLLPLSVLLSLPLGISGAYAAQKIAGLENNIYFQIALIMLVGLLAKNAILIVEFAVQRRHHGETIVMSAINAAKARLRPILMTSFAFILGLMPLVVAKGVGAAGNRSIGTGAAFGLLVGTFLGLLVIPVLYIIFQYLQEKVKPIKEFKHA